MRRLGWLLESFSVEAGSLGTCYGALLPHAFGAVQALIGCKLWVVQEISLAKTANVLVENTSLYWETFRVVFPLIWANLKTY
jgi:hypothetical protein